MSRFLTRPLLTVACAGALLAATPATAMAATHRAKPAPARHFAGTGLIVAHTANTATVLVHRLTDGRTQVTNKTITVFLAPAVGHGRRAVTQRRGHAVPPALINGNRLVLAGTATGAVGSGETFTATTAVQQAAPAHVFLGTVAAVNGSLVTVAKAATSRDDDGTDSPDAGSFTVDTGSASVTVDGSAGSLVIGQFVAVLGECDNDTVLASSVTALTIAPDVVAGEISEVTGTVVTLGDDDSPVTMDLAGVPLVLNGNSATADALTSGARLMALGSTDPAGRFTPSLAFGFDHGDRGPVGGNDD
jgi:hypothetical protein